eukprot:g15104.t1
MHHTSPEWTFGPHTVRVWRVAEDVPEVVEVEVAEEQGVGAGRPAPPKERELAKNTSAGPIMLNDWSPEAGSGWQPVPAAPGSGAVEPPGAREELVEAVDEEEQMTFLERDLQRLRLDIVNVAAAVDDEEGEKKAKVVKLQPLREALLAGLPRDDEALLRELQLQWNYSPPEDLQGPAKGAPATSAIVPQNGARDSVDDLDTKNHSRHATPLVTPELRPTSEHHRGVSKPTCAGGSHRQISCSMTAAPACGSGEAALETDQLQLLPPSCLPSSSAAIFADCGGQNTPSATFSRAAARCATTSCGPREMKGQIEIGVRQDEWTPEMETPEAPPEAGQQDQELSQAAKKSRKGAQAHHQDLASDLVVGGSAIPRRAEDFDQELFDPKDVLVLWADFVEDEQGRIQEPVQITRLVHGMSRGTMTMMKLLQLELVALGMLLQAQGPAILRERVQGRRAGVGARAGRGAGEGVVQQREESEYADDAMAMDEGELARVRELVMYEDPYEHHRNHGNAPGRGPTRPLLGRATF